MTNYYTLSLLTSLIFLSALTLSLVSLFTHYHYRLLLKSLLYYQYVRIKVLSSYSQIVFIIFSVKYF